MTRGRILCIEDNFDNRLLVKRVLEAEGYTVIEAENGTAGLAHAQTSQPDLILIDINLPDLDGYQCAARLRAIGRLREIPIIALTANVMEGDRQKALDAGCDGYIPKPIDVDQLPLQIAQHLHPDGQRKPPTPQIGPAAPLPQPPASRYPSAAPGSSVGISRPPPPPPRSRQTVPPPPNLRATLPAAPAPPKPGSPHEASPADAAGPANTTSPADKTGESSNHS